jgi:tetratricopeptide (TPR) repeat protein
MKYSFLNIPHKKYFFLVCIILEIINIRSVRAQTISWMAEGNQAYLDGNYVQAEKFYYHASLKEPSNSNAYYGIGICAYLLNHLKSALFYLNQSIHLNPQNINAKQMLFRVKFLLHQKSVPYASFSLMQWANQLYLQGQYSKAAGFYYKDCQYDPKNSYAYYGVGICEYLLTHLKTAQAYLQRSIYLNPNYHPAQIILHQIKTQLENTQIKKFQILALLRAGVLAFRSKQYSKASLLFHQAIHLDLQSANAYFNLALVYLKLKNWQKCYQNLERCLTIQPSYVGAYYALGVLYQKTGNTTEAKTAYDTVIGFPNAGSYRMPAEVRVSQLSASAFHFYARLTGGRTQGQQYQTTPPLVQPGTYNEYLETFLIYNPSWWNSFFSLDYSSVASLNEQLQQHAFQNYYQDLAVNFKPKISSSVYIPCAFDEATGYYNRFLTLQYQHSQFSGGFQWIFTNPDFIQIQGQFLKERYPTFPGYSDQSWITSIAIDFYFPGPHALNLTYTFRNNHALSSTFNYTDQTINLGYQYGGGNLFGINANYSIQKQIYPFFLGPHQSRIDIIQSGTLELSLPVINLWDVGIGDQLQHTLSTVSFYSQFSNNVYFFSSIFF